MKQALATLFIVFSTLTAVFAQSSSESIDYNNPKEYKIKSIKLESDIGLNRSLIIALSGLQVGQRIKIPGNDLNKCIQSLWKQKLFSDVQILAEKIDGEDISLLIRLKTRPRLSKYSFPGLKKSETKRLKDEIEIKRGDIITEQYLQSIRNKIRAYYVDKGYSNPSVKIDEYADTLFDNNSRKLKIFVDRNKKVKIKRIHIEGNNEFSDSKLRHKLKKTKQSTIQYFLRSHKFNEELYEEDKANLIAFYQSKGYRNAQLTVDSVYTARKNKVNIFLKVDEGNLFYFRKVTFSGNTKYSTHTLRSILKIKKGDIYNPEKLETNLRMNPGGLDITSLYMDNGYLFFNVTPVETALEGDSVDLEIRIVEGPQATIKRVTVVGNSKTNDHVVLREIRTRPGQKFSRADIIRTQRELAQLGYFDPEKLNVIPTPNQKDGTVDIEYQVEERPADQISLSGGYGAGQFVGMLGLTLSNFSAKNLLRPGEWGGPVPMGDGQRVSLNAQTSGRVFQSYSFSFTEPWFGGRKPNSLSFSIFHSIQSNNVPSDSPDRRFLKTTGIEVGLGKRLQWPDDWFTLLNRVGYKYYAIQNYNTGALSLPLPFSSGFSNSLYFTHVLGRNSTDHPIFPRVGSNLSLSFTWTPPWSFLTGFDATIKEFKPEEETDAGIDRFNRDKFKWLEYYKLRLDASFFTSLVGKLVLTTQLNFGYLGAFNKRMGITPFERFFVGGDGLQGFSLDGRELVRLRGYSNNSLTPSADISGGTIFNKMTMEMRYPLTMSQSATVYLLTFAEGGNNYLNFQSYNPTKLYRSAGFGIRVFLPMFGLLGFDWGYGFDEYDHLKGRGIGGSNFHISIGQRF